MTIALREKLYTHSGVRLLPLEKNSEIVWKVAHLTQNIQYEVSAAVAFVIVDFMGGQTIEGSLKRVEEKEISCKESTLNAIKWLKDKLILVEKDNKSHIWAKTILKKWNKYHWDSIADYHIATFDFPFIDYSKENGREFDIELMKQYELEEPDTNRTKNYESTLVSIKAPSAIEVLKTLDRPFVQVWDELTKPTLENENNKKVITKDGLLKCMSGTFGKLRTRKVNRGGKERDMIRKTSPSGGARHPTEAYVIAINVEDMESGVYHFNVESNSLDKINNILPKERLETIFEGPFRSRQEEFTEPSAIMFMTSVFERNMWRYREPRTYRTLFMDIGHLTTTFNLICTHLGYGCYFQHGMIDDEIEKIIGVHYLDEGVVWGAAIGAPGSFEIEN